MAFSTTVTRFKTKIPIFFLTLYFYLNFLLFADLSYAAHSDPSPSTLAFAESRVQAASAKEIAEARALIKEARAKAAVYNQYRLDHPFRTYPHQARLAKRTSASNETSASTPPPLFPVTKNIAKAAALLAEVDAAVPKFSKITTVFNRNATHSEHEPLQKRANSWWMGQKKHRGSWPWGKDRSYEVFRDVTDSKWATDGASRCVADGQTDCTAAINNAMKAGKRCGAGCNGSTTTQAIVYFPPGKYLISSTIAIYFGTQMIGDAANPPTIIASASFIGLGVFSVDEYVPDGGEGPDKQAKEWYINTANFYRQIRNFNFDLTKAGDVSGADGPDATPIAGIHYQVGQATSLMNLNFQMSGSKQVGVFAENGSGGHMSDLVFQGGGFGIWGGAQQFTSQRMTFSNVNVAVQLIWDWGWSFKSINVFGGSIGFKLVSKDEQPPHRTGSIIVLDSVFQGTGTAIQTFPVSPELKSGTTGITLENVLFSSVKQGVVDTDGKSYLSGSDQNVKSWVLGAVYKDLATRTFETGLTSSILRKSNLVFDDNNSGLSIIPYFERAKPQYTDIPWSGFMSVKEHGAKGDGSSDDTAVLQKIVDQAASQKKIVYFDAGTYILTDTLTFKSGSRVVGEAWAQLAASGSKFSDADTARAMIRVGEPGSVGNIEMQDLLFTTKGATAGVLLVEWNIMADGKGTAGMWDCHTRIGGAVGTDLTSAECPATANASAKKCTAGNLMMHIKKDASAYLENVWLWVADHDIDDPDTDDDNNNMVQCSIYVVRGLLIESLEPTWLYGTSSEHAIMYQYNIWEAANVFATMIQTESPYYQPTPDPPSMLQSAQRGLFHGDEFYLDCPGGVGCDSSWALSIQRSQNIYIAGAGLYSWFTSYDQSTCVDAYNCQQALLQLADNDGVQINNLITIGATTMIVYNEDTLISAADNLATDGHPFWSQITAFGVSETSDDNDLPPSNLKPCNDKFKTLEDLEAAHDKIPWNCQTQYTIETLRTVFDDSMARYRKILHDGYDHKFATYAESVAGSAADGVADFTEENGNKFFTCQVGEASLCCDTCNSKNKRECNYCRKDNKNCYKNCNRIMGCLHQRDMYTKLADRDIVPVLQYSKVPEPCPPDYSQRGMGPDNPYLQSVWWTMKSDMHDQFFAELLNATGIPAKKIGFGKRDRGNGCSSDSDHSNPDAECWYSGMDFDFPQPKGYSARDVVNPKSTVKSALDKGGLLGVQLEMGVFLVKNIAYLGEASDMIDAVALPIVTIAEAVDTMEQVSEIGAKIEKEKRKAMIMLFLTAIFMVIPIAGEVIGTVGGLAELGTALTLLGAAGNIALDAYTVATDPQNRPLAIFGLVLAPLSIFDAARMAKAAKLQRAMTAGEIAKSGVKVSKRMKIVHTIGGVCRRMK
ncbi:hypothetical protein AA313_de0205493 [Arthrobotrys entomopaga]|nr:hypothetical protein AA313_de0205493 [Arthrobotrys entomopaga]